jgi:hypothetical protein
MRESLKLEKENEPLGHARQLADHDSRRLIIVALVPPQAALDPPPVFTLVVKQHATAAADVILEFWLSILLLQGPFLNI